MNPETICCSFETAKKLKEAGFNKESVFVWLASSIGGYTLYERNGLGYKLDNEMDYYLAPTATEIELPMECAVITSLISYLDGHREYMCGEFYEDENKRKYTKDIIIGCYGPKFRGENHFTNISFGLTEVDTKALAWLYLKKIGLI
jgi:hypothetical protein